MLISYPHAQPFITGFIQVQAEKLQGLHASFDKLSIYALSLHEVGKYPTWVSYF